MNQNEKAALREILAQRESMYRLLRAPLKTEADKDLLDGLGAAGFPEEDGGLGEGFRLIADWLRDPKSEDPVTELAESTMRTPSSVRALPTASSPIRSNPSIRVPEDS